MQDFIEGMEPPLFERKPDAKPHLALFSGAVLLSLPKSLPAGDTFEAPSMTTGCGLAPSRRSAPRRRAAKAVESRCRSIPRTAGCWPRRCGTAKRRWTARVSNRSSRRLASGRQVESRGRLELARYGVSSDEIDRIVDEAILASWTG